MTIRIRVKNGDKVSRSIRARYKKAAKKASRRKDYLEVVLNTFKFQIQKSSTLPNDKKVKKIGEKWRERRKKLSRVNDTDRFYGAGKSNLTFTGQFINSFKIRVSDLATIKIFPIGKHKGYKGTGRKAGVPYPNSKAKKGKRGKSVSNKDIARGQIDQGRDYTKVGKKFLKKITTLFKTSILKEVRKEFSG